MWENDECCLILMASLFALETSMEWWVTEIFIIGWAQN